jgi:thiamine biosynthesis lipoprotein
MQTVELRAMGGRLFAAVDDDGCDPGWKDDLIAHFTTIELRASRFLAHSELSQLNKSSGGTVEVSRAFWMDIAFAIEAARWSEGLVTPTVLEALEAHGYDRSFELLAPCGASPASETRSDASPYEVPHVASFEAIELDSARFAVRLPPGLRLDLGGTVKGRAADTAAAALGRHTPALVDAGGDVAVSGPRRDGTPWPIGIGDPRQPDRMLELIGLEHGGVATSGRDFRRWKTERGEAHHLIDPRTGLPANTDVLSATVIAASAFRAEVAAKVIVLLGASAGLAWIEARAGLAALVVLEDGTILRSSQFEAQVWRDE